MQRSIKGYLNTRPETRPTKFVDFFCGFGGASVGAAAAGLEVVLAVDSNFTALATHKKNHPQAQHVCARLPSNKLLPMPADNTFWHLHGSPPCTSVSTANQNRDEKECNDATDVVEWFIKYAISSSAISWSMEQVPTPPIMKCMYKLKTQLSHNHFDFEIFNFCRLGVPQNRRRLIAGTPELVARLRRAPLVYRSVYDVIKKPRGTHIRNVVTKSRIGRPIIVDGKRVIIYSKKKDDDCCIPITGHSHCVVASYPLRWATPNSAKKVKLCCLNVDETMRLQCFPPEYKLPRRKADCIRGIGNALPPTIMQQMLAPT